MSVIIRQYNSVILKHTNNLNMKAENIPVSSVTLMQHHRLVLSRPGKSAGCSSDPEL